MEETFGLFGRGETEILDLDFDVSDDALEIASGSLTAGNAAFTLSFCSGLDTCPA